MPTVIIDGTEYHVREGRNLLEAALDNGLDLPYFCWHPAMGSVGACRLCAVRVYKDANDTKGRIQMACMTAATDGTRMSINDPEAAEFRRHVIEWLMTNHPHDCPVCDEGGECHLQDMTVMCGQVYRRYRFAKRTFRNQYLGPLVNHELNRCIQCYRCVRFYRDLAGGDDLDVFGSRNRLYFGRREDGVLQSEFSGNLVEVCPTGVFTDKTYDRHYTRKWDLESAPSVCTHCGLGCNIILQARYGMLRRVTARFNGEVNGYFLCDRGRYGYEFVNSESRISGLPTGWDEALDRAGSMLREAKGVIGIGSPRASLESNYALRKLVGKHSFSTGLSAFEHESVDLALKVLREGPARTPSLAEVELADVVLILAADPTNEAPMLDFAIRQAMRKAPLDIARKLKIPDWDANAVTTALQNAKGKLYVASPWPIKLEKIGAESLRIRPGEIAAFADAVRTGRALSGPDPDDIAARVAADLADARQPLIVTSISAGLEVVASAANLAWSLCVRGKDCWLTVAVPEANTLGVAMLGGMSAADALERVVSGEADTLIVLENDLSRRVEPDLLGRALDRCANLTVLDCIHAPIASRARVVLPTAAWVESNGTFINNEGRAQRFYQVFLPPRDVRPAWQPLQALRKSDRWETYEDVLSELASDIAELAGAFDAAPGADWRAPAGRKIARMPHRFSGRTAKDANVTVIEPRPPDDPETPFAFTMEGEQNVVPGPVVPRFWYPGWNSENAVSKFQIEVGGPLDGGNPGKRLIEPSGALSAIPPQPETPSPSQGEGRGEGAASHSIILLPRPRIFGSEELSCLAEGIAELIPAAEVVLHPDTAARFGLSECCDAEITIGRRTLRLPVRLDASTAHDCAVAPAGFSQTIGITSPVWVKIARAEQ